jgi:hypothetical protein
VRSRNGNFRILEGMWEGNGFYLQRFVDLIEMMPSGVFFDRIRASVLAMLRLSEALCERAGLARWIVGSELSLDALEARQAPRLLLGQSAEGRACFSVYSNNGLDHVGTYNDQLRRTPQCWHFAYRQVRIAW